MGCGCSGASAQAVESPIDRTVQAARSSENQELLETFSWSLETVLAAFDEADLDINASSVRLLVDALSSNATPIINQREGKGRRGTCPFSSAYEVEMFYKFSLGFLRVWSVHKMCKDEDEDAAFYSQLNMLCEILNSLDTSALCLPQLITENIESLKREAFWPNWFAGEMMKGEAAARRCLAIGKEWNLEESEAYHNALATIEGGNQSGSELQSNAHNSIIMFLLTASASKNV